MKYTKEQIEKLMDGFGNVDLSETNITSLPDNLTVGGWLDPRGTNITEWAAMRVKRLSDGDYVPCRYLFADGILTHVKRRKNLGEYTLYVGKIPGKNVISDGVNYAHCDKFRDGIADLKFKALKDRSANQYKGIDLDSEMAVDELVTMYRIITGACAAASASFVDSLGNELKEKYTVREAFGVTKGQYGAERFREFFEV